MCLFMIVASTDLLFSEVVAALRAHGRTSSAVAEKGCWAIGNVSSGSDIYRRRVVGAGVCEGEGFFDALLNLEFGSVSILVRCLFVTSSVTIAEMLVCMHESC